MNDSDVHRHDYRVMAIFASNSTSLVKCISCGKSKIEHISEEEYHFLYNEGYDSRGLMGVDF